MKILYVSTISNTINAFLVPHIKLLIEQGHQVDVACNIKREISNELLKLNCKVFDVEFQRSPLTKANYMAYKKLKKLIINEDYDIVHTHTPVASTCTRLACKSLTDVKVLYTAHGFHFFKGAPIKNWLLYYPIEYWLSKYTDVLITINVEDYELAKKAFKAKKIKYIQGVGINTKMFSQIENNLVNKRKELGIGENAHIVLSVGELNKNKNHETIIKAIAKLDNPNIYYLICGEGPLKEHLLKLIKDYQIESRIKLLGFRDDVVELCNIADIFVFPSFREGLSVALMEAMANGLPVVCSNIRGNSDLIEDEKGGFLLEPTDVDGFTKYIDKLILDRQLRNDLGDFNLEKIDNYSIKNVLSDMEEIYYKLREFK